jgi:iron complex outermembrane receptor protein
MSIASGAAFAQSPEPSSADLQAVTVSGSRSAINPNTPSATDSIDRSRLADLNIANPEDSVKYLPNVATRKRYIGDRNGAVETRGTNNRQSARSLVLADGVMLSNFLGAQDQIAPRWSMVFPEEIDRVDVIYGPFSALYSGNAMGAAILFTTRMPKTFEANAAVQLQSQQFDFLGTQKTLKGQLESAFIGNRSGPWSYQLGLSRLDSTSQPTGFASFAKSTVAATAADRVAQGAFSVPNRLGAETLIFGANGGGIERTQQTDVKFKLAYDITPELQTRLTAIRWTNERTAGSEGDTTYLRDSNGAAIYSGNVSVGGMRYSIPANTFSPRAGSEEHNNVALSLKSNYAVGWNIDAVASVYTMSKNLARTSTTAPPTAFQAGAGTLNIQDGSGWQTLDIKLDRRPEGTEAHWLTLGAHMDRYVFKQDNFNTADWRSDLPNATSSIVRGNTETQALFAQDAWTLSPNFKAILGLRVENWRTFGGTSVGGVPSPITLPDRNETATSPKAALEYSPGADWLFRASVARATRFPTPIELFQGNISAVAKITSDPNLKPERGTFIDLTAERYFNKGSSRVTLYQEDTQDTLFNQSNSTTLPSTSNMQNIDQVRVRGIEFAADTRGVLLSRLDLSGSLAFNDAVVLANANSPATVGKLFPQIPRQRATFVAIWRQTGDLNFSLAGRYSGDQFANLNNDDVERNAFNSLSSFAVLDARVNYRFNAHARLSVGVDNLANRFYAVNHPFPQRSFVTELKLAL